MNCLHAQAAFSASGEKAKDPEDDGRPALWDALGVADEQQDEDVVSLRRQLAEALEQDLQEQLQAKDTELIEEERQLDNALAKTRDHRRSGTPPKARRSSIGLVTGRRRGLMS